MRKVSGNRTVIGGGSSILALCLPTLDALVEVLKDALSVPIEEKPLDMALCPGDLSGGCAVRDEGAG